MISRYSETYAAWQRDPLNFWAEAAKEIDQIQAPQKFLMPKRASTGVGSPMRPARPVGIRWIATWWLGKAHELPTSTTVLSLG